ncbi:protein YIPF2 [Trypanosoma rangeli]|uniref:Protein YIPF n=1 Tax=Trypanosoma rangeli TaxID=5698 RepID=A0A422N136_TRYRA|nr:protein YIPF2 [Trypanosoma rangeli]RNE99163.1 protein YIPF2 [Trypanosoma rangeli]|eukprot:RNE99163.1 protein YIPF2 [Trypanosoma rangeli]
MANPYEKWEDSFKEKPFEFSHVPTALQASAEGHTTMITPFAEPQTTYTSAGQPDQPRQTLGHTDTSQAYASQQQFYDGSSAPGSLAQPLPPSPALPVREQYTQTADQQQQEQRHEQTTSVSKFWTIEFYQQFFDVDTRLVLLRMSNALVPVKPPDFLMDREWRNYAVQTPPYELQETGVELSGKPDLYGPFWISTTLWMTLGVVSNVMSRIAFSHRASDSEEKWKYDFTMASIASIVIYIYCFGLSCFVWGMMKYKELPVSLLDTLCLYGYSMFIFLPVVILCTIPVSALQWVIVMVGGVWSTAFLLINFWRLWEATLSRVWFMGIVAVVSVFHMLLTMSFKFYFLRYKF